MSEKLKQILRLGGTYGLANVYHQVLFLIVIPIYTAYLSTEDYGISGLMAISAGFILAITKTASSYGFNRHYFSPEYINKRGELFFGSIVFALMQSGLIAIIFYIFAEYFAELILENSSFANIIKIYSLIIFIQPLEELFQDLAKLQKKAKLLSIMHILNVTFSVAITLILMIIFNQKVISLIWGAFSITFFTAIYMLPNALREIKWKLDIKILRPAIAFGLPMILAIIALYSMKNVDIYIVKSYLGVASAGKYHFGYKFGALLNFFFVLPLKSIIEPMIYELEYEKEKLIKFVKQTATYFYASAILLALSMALFAQELLLILASKIEFQSAWFVIPAIAFAHVFFGMMDLFGRGILMAKKTLAFSIIYALGAFVNILLNIILIPIYGILGAAYATLVAYIFISIISAVLSAKFYGQSFEWNKILIISIVAIVIYYFSAVILEINIYTILLKIGMIIVYLVFAYFFLINRHERFGFAELFFKKKK